MRKTAAAPRVIRAKTVEGDRTQRYRNERAMAWMLVAVSLLLLLVTASGIVGMTTRDRWQHAERLFHAALAHIGSERAAFVRDACRGDEPLRQDVESLLAFELDAQAFMAASAFEIAIVSRSQA